MADEAVQVRPRQHILEELSERHFASATPEQWVPRPAPKDYGVDYEVEVFDDGRRTGMFFKVQLKATDAETTSLSMKISDFRYWTSLDVPVLLVLFKASTNELFSQWAHAHNPWPQPDEDQKTTTVHFSESYSEHQKRIPRELQLIREVRARGVQMPVTVAIVLDDPGIVRGLRHTVRQALVRLDARRLVKVVTNDAYVTVSLSGDTMVAAAPASVSTVTAHGISVTLDDVPLLVPDLLCLVSVLLSQVGSDQAAAGLLLAVFPELNDEMKATFAPAFAGALAAAGRWEELAGLLDDATDLEAADEMFAAALLSSRATSPTVALRFIDFARRSAAELRDSGLAGEGSRRLLNGSLFAVEHDMWDVVEELLVAAADMSVRYREEYLYYQLRGKARWNLGDRAGAFDFYERAWDLGWRTEQAVAAYGEAMLLQGLYGRARDHLAAVDENLMTRWALLIKCAVDDIIEIVGLLEQDRRPVEEGEHEGLEDSDNAEMLIKVLRERDALNPGLLHAYVKATDGASLGVMVWYAVNAEDAGWWLMAIAGAHKFDADEEITRAIVEAATLEFPEVVELFANIATAEEVDVDEEYVERVRQIADAAEPYEGPGPLHIQRGFWDGVAMVSADPPAGDGETYRG